MTPCFLSCLFTVLLGKTPVWPFSCSCTSSETREEKMSFCHKHPWQLQSAVQEKKCVQIPCIIVSDKVKRPISSTKEYTHKEIYRVYCCVWRGKWTTGITPNQKDSFRCTVLRHTKETADLNQKKECGDIFRWCCILQQMFGPDWNSIYSSDREMQNSSRWCFNTCIQWVQHHWGQQCQSATWCGHSKSNSRRE